MIIRRNRTVMVRRERKAVETRDSVNGTGGVSSSSYDCENCVERKNIITHSTKENVSVFRRRQ